MSNLKLTTILENMDTIPSSPISAKAKKFNDKPTLTPQEKKSLMEKVGMYNQHSEAFASADKLVELANELAEIAKLGKTYAVNECDEWFQTETIKRDFNSLDKVVSEFNKCAKECYGTLQRARALYEDAGNIIERYYEIKDINPTTELPQDQLPPDESPSEEIIPNESVSTMTFEDLGIDWDKYTQ
jgi:hypothetical protein